MKRPQRTDVEEGMAARAGLHRKQLGGPVRPGVYRTEKVGYLDEHLDWMRRCGRADRTVAARVMVLCWLAEFLGHDPAAATAAELDRWQATLSTLSKVRWQTMMIRPYYRYLQARGVRNDDPALLLPVPRVKRRLPKPIPDDKLLAAVAQAPPEVLPWLLLGGWCGLRADEIARMAVEQFGTDRDGQVWARVIGKGDAERDVPVPAWAWAHIAPQLPETGLCWSRRYRPQDGPVTAKHVSDNVNYYLRVKCGMPYRLHSLRKRVATAALRDTGDLRMVQELLGHANLSTLHVYTAVERGDMAAAVTRLPRPDLPAPRDIAGAIDGGAA